MANIASARKRARQTIKRTGRNANLRTRMRNTLRKVEEALASGDPQAAALAARAGEAEVARAAQRGLVHRRAASRKIARIARRLKTLTVAPKGG